MGPFRRGAAGDAGRTCRCGFLVPAFMISELKNVPSRSAFLLFPARFLIIDLVVASVLMSMGMMMLAADRGVAAVSS